MKPKIIAFYLPQFYPFKENDEWWGKGFTEWTNVGKAKPLWKGHYQPRVPADLGYYDLRVPEVREQQAELAREAGITAFCYWHYWFGNGKRLLERVFDEVLESGKPDFPFCLGWANHTWFAKTWDDSNSDKVLMKQTYPGIEDARNHFNFLLKAFKDPRYLKIDGKPFFFIHDTPRVPKEYISNFKKWTKEAGFPGLFIVGNAQFNETYDKCIEKGFDAVTYDKIYQYREYSATKLSKSQTLKERLRRLIHEKITGIPRCALDYAAHYKNFIEEQDKDPLVIPELIPQWDHSPRSGEKSLTVFYNSTPTLFYEHAKMALEAIKNKPEERQILILKSWNEWGEGNYMEPDLKYGRGFIDGLRKAVDEYIKL